MRGSPLLRTLFVTLALIGAAWAILSLSAKPPASAVENQPRHEDPKVVEIPFFLSCSAIPESVVLETSGEVRSFQPDRAEITGTLPITGEHPTIFITVTWRDDTELPRFAKLTIEPADHPTRSKTFDAVGEISDVWEPHLH